MVVSYFGRKGTILRAEYQNCASHTKCTERKILMVKIHRNSTAFND